MSSSRRIAGGAGLKNVREVGESLTKPGGGPRRRPGGRGLVEKLLDVVGSDLLDYGQSVITGMRSTTGQGDPENGDAFGEAQSTFNGVNETLKSAVPDNGWDGAGSYAYADQNTRQQLRSEAMADADHEVHKVLYREAAQITLRRGYLDDQYNFLANTSYVTFPLQFIPRYGEAMKLAIEIAALQTALGKSYYQMNQLQSEVARTPPNCSRPSADIRAWPTVPNCPAPQSFRSAAPTTGRRSRRGRRRSNDRSRALQQEGLSARPAFPVASPPCLPGFRADGHGGHVERGRLQPMAAGPPPLPQVPALGSVLSPVAGFVTGAAPAAGQPAAAPGRPRSKKAPGGHSTTSRQRRASPTSWPTDDKDPTQGGVRRRRSRARAHSRRNRFRIPTGCNGPSRLGWMRTIHPGRRPGRHRRIRSREEGTMSGDDLRVTTAHLGELAVKQGRAAAGIRSATIAGGRRRRRGQEHPRQHRLGVRERAGKPCSAARRSAGTKMAEISDDLCEKLTRARRSATTRSTRR